RSALDLIEQVINSRKRILVVDGDLVQPSVVDAHLHCAILVVHKEDRCTPS
ncbi:hypothetical protein LINGRAHAP2_LOCUS23192, partial [Linum grandiflorum]